MLTIYQNSINLSDKLKNFIDGSVNISLDNGDSFYIGYYKPINAVYIELETNQELTTGLSVKYFNGSFIDSTATDNTNAFKNSGFIKWKRNLSGEKKTTISGQELYWYKIDLSTVEQVSIDFKGINLVFSDDKDLKEEYPTIMDHVPESDSSFIGFHQSARNDIISNLSNREEVYQDNGLLKQLDQFDLLDSEEVRSASKYLTLSKIFNWLSDQPDDNWHRKAMKFEADFANRINRFRFSIDSNDNGIQDAEEKLAINVLRIERE